MYGNEKIPLPTGRRILVSAGDFKFLLEFFVVTFFVSYAPYPYFAALSAGLAMPIYFFLIPKISKRINRLKSPLNRILLPFALSSLAVCPLFVQVFRLHAFSRPLKIIFTVAFLPLFSSLMSLSGFVSGGIARALGSDTVYGNSKKGIRIISIVMLVCLAYFDMGSGEASACIVAIFAALGFLTQYMAVYDFSSRFKAEEDIKSRAHAYEILEIAALFSIGVIAANTAVYCLAGYGRLEFSIVVGGFAIIISAALYALKIFKPDGFITEKVVKIVQLFGVLASGLIISLNDKRNIVIASVAVALALLVLSITFRVLFIRKIKGENHD